MIHASRIRILLVGLSVSAASLLVPTSSVFASHDEDEIWNPFNYDFTCGDTTTHCTASIKDNVTLIIDTDASMNASSGVDVDSDTTPDTYWDATVMTIDEIADDNHLTGDCTSSGGSCNVSGCDPVRLGIGYYGDNSIDDGSGINAYEEHEPDENAKNDVQNSISNEEAGTIGTPAVEQITCPPDGPGQSEIITVPSAGVAKVMEVACPVNGSPQVDDVECPPNGAPQVDQVICATILPQVNTVRVDVGSFNGFYAFDVESTQISGSTGTTIFTAMATDVLPSMWSDLLTHPDVTPVSINYLSPMVGEITFRANVPAVALTVDNPDPNPASVNINEDQAAQGPTGSFTIDIEGTPVTFNVGSSQAEACSDLLTEINAVSGTTGVTATNLVLGQSLNLTGPAGTSFSSDLSNITSDGFTHNVATTAHVVGLPAVPADGTTYLINIEGTPISFDIGPDQATTCSNLRTAINADSGTTGVTASDLVTGQSLSLTGPAGVSFASDLSTITSNGFTHNVATTAHSSGLPGDPAAGTGLTVTLNGTPYTYMTMAGDLQDDVCDALASELDDANSGEGVTATASGGVITVTAMLAGEDFTMTSGDLGVSVNTPNTPGLPGDPGPSYTYDVTINGTMTSWSFPGPGNPTSSDVCTGLAAAIDGDGEVTAVCSFGQIELTPNNPGETFSVDAVDAELGFTASGPPAGLPFDPGSGVTYELTIDGTVISFTDDGSPTQQEICDGLADEINNDAGALVTAVSDGTTITLTGTSTAPFTPYDFSHPTYTVWSEITPVAGGPASYSALASMIDAELTVTSRDQRAIVVTNRPPDDLADMTAAITTLCTKRDDPDDPVTTHFIGFDLDADEQSLLSVLATAGGSGMCCLGSAPCGTSNQVDPCSVSVVSAGPIVTAGYECIGAATATAASLKYRINDVVEVSSCTLDLDVPSSYPDGQAPDNQWAVAVQVRNWDLDDLEGRPEIWGNNTSYWDDLDYTLEDWHDVDDDDADPFDGENWYYVDNNTRVTFTGLVCEEIRTNNIRRIETTVGCQCPNQGEPCTISTTEYCPPGSLTLCSQEQLDNMRCATGVYICDDGVQSCQTGEEVPEICNGVDDDCDGITDNMSATSDPTVWDGYDVGGKHCNFLDTCVCPDDASDVPSSGQDLQAHLDSWTGVCTCAEGLEPALFSPASADDLTPDEAYGDSDAACSVGTNAPAGGAGALLVLGAFGLIRRRRRS